MINQDRFQVLADVVRGDRPVGVPFQPVVLGLVAVAILLESSILQLAAINFRFDVKKSAKMEAVEFYWC